MSNVITFRIDRTRRSNVLPQRSWLSPEIGQAMGQLMGFYARTKATTRRQFHTCWRRIRTKWRTSRLA